MNVKKHNMKIIKETRNDNKYKNIKISIITNKFVQTYIKSVVQLDFKVVVKG